MASYSAKGEKLDITPASAVAAGEIVVVGSLVTMAERAIPAGELGAVLTNGIVTGPVFTTGATAAQGSAIRWYAVSGVFDAATGTPAGYLARARAASDRTVSVLLWPGS